MDSSIAFILLQDGVTNGAVYALIALALVLVFAVTCVIFVAHGDFVSYGALTLAALQSRKVPGTVWLVVGLALLAGGTEIVRALRARQLRKLPRIACLYMLGPSVVLLTTLALAPRDLPQLLQVALMLLIVVPLGPIVYRLAYQPVADASILVLFIVSIAVHFTLQGLGLMFFGPEGARTTAFIDARLQLGVVSMSGQALFIVGACALLILSLHLFFEHSLQGKALRAAAVNRVGARLVGMSIARAGSLTFVVAASIGAISGALIAPIATVYYDSGFLIGLKAFVAAIVGALASYPLAAAAAVVVGLVEAFASFSASAYKEVIVFTLIIPVLLWRSLNARHVGEEG